MVAGVYHIIKKLYERVPALGTAVEDGVLIQMRFEAETEWLEMTKGALWLGHCMRQPVRGNWSHVLGGLKSRIHCVLCHFFSTVPSACFPISRGVPESASSFSLFCVINFYLSIPLQCYFTRLGFLGNVHSASDPKRKRTKKVRVSFFFNKFHLFCIVLSSLLSGNLGSSSRIHHGDSSNGSFTPWTLLVSASRKFYLETCQALEEGRNGLPKMLLLGIQRSCTNYIFCQAGWLRSTASCILFPGKEWDRVSKKLIKQRCTKET